MCTSQVEVAKLFGAIQIVLWGKPQLTQELTGFSEYVNRFSQSWKKNGELTIAKHEKQLWSHKLKGDCYTCWGLTLEMVKRIVALSVPGLTVQKN